jgi:hypothetical protein
MIHSKILLIELELNKDSLKNKELLTALNSIKKLLNQIDFTAEVLPLEEFKKVKQVFESLKNESLTKNEKFIIKQLIKY